MIVKKYGNKNYYYDIGYLYVFIESNKNSINYNIILKITLYPLYRNNMC